MSGELYEALGVDKTASKAEIRRAYRRRAKKAHPDAGGNREEWDRLHRELMVLEDDKTRERYDRTGDADAAGPDQSGAVIHQMVMMAVEHVIAVAGQKRINPETIDIIADASRFMRDRIAEENAKIRAKEKEALGIRKMARRFKAKKGKPNIIGTMFDARAADVERDCETIREQIAQIGEALKLLNDHTFDWSSAPPSYESPMTRSLPSFFEDAFR